MLCVQRDLTAGHSGIQAPSPYDQKSHCRGVQSYPTTCLGGGECLWAVPVTARRNQSPRVPCTPTKTWAPQGQRRSFESWYHQYSASPRANDGELLTNEWMNVLIHGFDFQNLLSFSNAWVLDVCLYSFTQFSFKIFCTPRSKQFPEAYRADPWGRGGTCDISTRRG